MKFPHRLRPSLALALRRARSATVDGRFPRRPDRAVGRLESALGRAGRADRVSLLEGIAALHAESARRGAGADAGVRSVEALRRALADAGPDEAVILAQLADAQAALYEMTRDAGLLREAIATARRAVDQAPADPLARIMVLSSVAALLLRAGTDLADPDLFEEAAVVVENSLAAGGGSPLNLAYAHRLRYEYDGEAETLARAETAARDAVARCEEHGLDAADEFAELAQVLRYRSARTDGLTIAAEAATAAREALDRTAEGGEEYSRRACLLAGVLTECHYAGDPEALAQAVEVVRAAMSAEASRAEAAGRVRPPAPDPANRTAPRGTGATGAAALGEAPPSTPATPSVGPDVWQIAAAVLGAWADQHEDVGVAQEAEGAARTALVLAGDDEQLRAVALDTLADVLRSVHLLTGDPEPLGEAIAHGESAALTEAGPPGDRAGRIGNLGVLLRLRHEQTGAHGDLDAAIDRYGEALALLGDDHPDAGIHFNNLGSALAARTALHSLDDELDEAIAVGRAAVRGGGPAFQRVLRMSNLGGALYERYRRGGDLACLDEDIDLQREALLLAPPDHPERPVCSAIWPRPSPSATRCSVSGATCPRRSRFWRTPWRPDRRPAGWRRSREHTVWRCTRTTVPPVTRTHWTGPWPACAQPWRPPRRPTRTSRSSSPTWRGHCGRSPRTGRRRPRRPSTRRAVPCSRSVRGGRPPPSAAVWSSPWPPGPARGISTSR